MVADKMSVLSAVSDSGQLISSLVFGMILLNPLIPYSVGSHVILTKESNNAAIR